MVINKIINQAIGLKKIHSDKSKILFSYVESVYSKIVLNSQQLVALIERLKRKAPKKGLIQVLTITEKQYSQIEYIIGESNSKIINNEVVVL